MLILLSVLSCLLSIDVEAQTRRDGEFLFNEGRYLEAYEVYVKLMNRYPKDYLLKYQAGRCLYEMERYDEAVLLLEVAAKKDIFKANIFSPVKEVRDQHRKNKKQSPCCLATVRTLTHCITIYSII